MGVNPGVDCERLAFNHVAYGKGFGSFQYKSLLRNNFQNVVALGHFQENRFRTQQGNVPKEQNTRINNIYQCNYT